MTNWPLAAAAALVLAGCGRSAAPSQGSDVPSQSRIGGSMILATTTSTQDSGLLEVLIPIFERETGVDLKIIAVGTGAALEMAAKGDADVILVHAPASEKKYVESGDLVDGQLVMHNDFVIAGPPSDPARVKGVGDLRAVTAAIAATGPFISRGDGSGTHSKELELWKAAGVDPKSGVKKREETGQGMGATLNVADQKGGYTLVDRATYLALRRNLALEIVFEGDAALFNVYHAYVVNPEKHGGVKVAQARAFVAFLVAPETQRLIGEFGKADFGQPLFVPDAGKPEALGVG